MGPRLGGAVELAQAGREREVRPVRRWVDVEQLLERLARQVELAAVVVRAAERLEDRALARLLAGGALRARSRPARGGGA